MSGEQLSHRFNVIPSQRRGICFSEKQMLRLRLSMTGVHKGALAMTLVMASTGSSTDRLLPFTVHCSLSSVI